MITHKPFAYKPLDSENEKASNSYVMSLVAIVAGLPLPIINVIATLIFYFGNTRQTYFVRWHCAQALISQFSLAIVNGIGFWWTFSIIFGDKSLSNGFIAYVLIAMLYNLLEFIATIYTATQTRKGEHVEWWLIGDIANSLVSPQETNPLNVRP
jgi:uncharacterized membrane protein